MIYDPIVESEIPVEGSTLKVAIKLRIHPPKRRSPSQRLHARLYYRRNRARIRMQRRRYLRIHRSIIKHRKMFMRYKPSWFKKPQKSVHPNKIKVTVPKAKKPKPFHLFKPPKSPSTKKRQRH